MATVGELIAKITLGGMDTVEKQLRRFSSSMSKTAQSLKEMGQRFAESGERFIDMGENLTMITAGLTAMGVAGVAASENVTNSINSFKTKLGATGQDLAMYENTLKEVAKTGVGSFEEVSNAIVAVSQTMRGLSSAELKAVTEESMHLAQVMGKDVPEVTKTAGVLMQEFGVSGQQALDMITKGYQLGIDVSGNMLDGISQQAEKFKALGFSAMDMFNIMADGAKTGKFSIDEVGSALDEFTTNALNGSKETQKVFQALGLNAKSMTSALSKGGEDARGAFIKIVTALSNVKDEQKRAELGAVLFGDAYKDIEKNVLPSLTHVANHMKNVQGAAQELAKNNKTFKQEMIGAWNEIQIALKPFGDALKGAITDVMPVIVSAVKSLASAFSGLSPTMQKVVIGIMAFAAIIPIIVTGIGLFVTFLSPLMTGLGVIAQGFGLLGTAGMKMIGVFRTIGTAIMTLGRFLIANPWIALAVGLITVAVLIYQNWDKIVAYTKQVFSALKAWFAPYWEAFKQMVSAVVQAFISAWNSTKAFFVNLWNGIVQVVQAVFNVIKTIFLIYVGIWITILAPIWNAFATVFNACGQVVAVVWNYIKAGALALWNAIIAGLNRVRAFFASIWNAISAVVSSVISRIKSIVQTLIATATSVVNRVRSVFSAAWNAIYGSVISPVVSRIKSIVQTLVSTASSVVNRVRSFFSSAWNSIRSLVSSAISAIINKISSIWSSASSVASRIKSAFSNLFGHIKLPHFHLSGKFSLMPPSVPKISVSWYAKGGILDTATLIGVGERGAEAIVPLSSQRRMKPFAQAVARFMPTGAKAGGNTTIHVAQMIIREEADIQRVAKELNRLQERKERARGGLVYG